MATATKKQFSAAQIATAVERLKTKRPDLWAKWKSDEEMAEGFGDIADDITALLKPLGMTQPLRETTQLLRELRTPVRLEAGLWVRNSGAAR
jgi:hypothetical protein